jgi:hypothetical protein
VVYHSTGTMRHVATWLVVVAVGGLAAAAGVDALRGDSQPAKQSAAPPETVEGPPLPVPELRAAGVEGVLTYADENCVVRALALPDLTIHAEGGTRTCAFRVSAGNVLSFGRAIADPSRFVVAECRGDVVELRTDGRVLGHYSGCSPVWRDDRSLTLVRRGEVVLLEGPLAQPEFVRERVLVSRRGLVREFRRAGWSGRVFEVQEAVWLSGRRLAAIVRAQRGEDARAFLVVFAGGRLAYEPRFGYSDLAALRPSPLGRFASARIVEPGGIAVVDRRGRPVELDIGVGHALAWSPDENWVAEATDDGIYVSRADEPTPRLIHLPILARDLVWR